MTSLTTLHASDVPKRPAYSADAGPEGFSAEPCTFCRTTAAIVADRCVYFTTIVGFLTTKAWIELSSFSGEHGEIEVPLPGGVLASAVDTHDEDDVSKANQQGLSPRS